MQREHNRILTPGYLVGVHTKKPYTVVVYKETREGSPVNDRAFCRSLAASRFP